MSAPFGFMPLPHTAYSARVCLPESSVVITKQLEVHGVKQFVDEIFFYFARSSELQKILIADAQPSGSPIAKYVPTKPLPLDFVNRWALKIDCWSLSLDTWWALRIKCWPLIFLLCYEFISVRPRANHLHVGQVFFFIETRQTCLSLIRATDYVGIQSYI